LAEVKLYTLLIDKQVRTARSLKLARKNCQQKLASSSETGFASRDFSPGVIEQKFLDRIHESSSVGARRSPAAPIEQKALN
jgi:hypothetical protein